MKDIIVIVGPTGVGKTKLSIELAKYLDAEIINGDSVSIYKDLNIGSAKPTIEEQENIPHHLIDINDINDLYSVYNYQIDSRKIINELQSKNKNIIIVGGTGLYIKSALYDYKFNEEKNNNDYNNLTNLEIFNKIKEINKDIDIHINNRQRLIRCLNKLENKEELTKNKDIPLYNFKIIGLTTERNTLYNRINKRVDNMIDNGLLDEVHNLKKHYETSKILNSAIGYKEFINYFNKNKSLEEIIEEIKKNSRHYAKRQYTFFNHQMPVEWFDVDFNNFNNTINKAIDYINN